MVRDDRTSERVVRGTFQFVLVDKSTVGLDVLGANGINNAVRHTNASGVESDTADHWSLLDGLARGRGWVNRRKFLTNQSCGAGDLNGHAAGLKVSVEHDLNLDPLQKYIHYIPRALGADNDGSATGEPDGVNSGNIINLEAVVISANNMESP